MEKLTGKCKEDLLNFYWNNYIGKTRFLEQKSETEDFFNSLYPILQNALIIEFFDSVGIYVNALSFEKGLYWKSVCENVMISKKFESRIKAMNSAIIKSNELYNSKQ